MTSISQTPSIICTEQGLTISGTRITICDVMDYLATERSPHLIQNWLPLTDEQLDIALTYIQHHPQEVEAEYQDWLKMANEIRQYWNNCHRQRTSSLPSPASQRTQPDLWNKLQAHKAKHSEES